ncbi:MAG TPA: STAS domain-containing protein [Leptospiraceae bacterium]|nr:STAS domain-containing protein [Leptospiraceae bacterium]HMZ58168.1 STAS domain-containing protein [Leptospiraceae bacterium]HNF14703.1 STAS domain-containing protein [Leptospiraceae bacterium]HNF24245.1 STAS domain-containing protein [Leptospiraceae bacterium]HNH08602.1 STAS domain-containing protein [Leptospiraceae bacterium]
MSFNHTSENGIEKIEVEESLDLYSVPALKKYIKSLFVKGAKKVLVTLQQKVFVDSSGIGMIYNLCYEADSSGIRIAFHCEEEQSAYIVQKSKMDEKLPLFTDLKSALNHLE